MKTKLRNLLLAAVVVAGVSLFAEITHFGKVFYVINKSNLEQYAGQIRSNELTASDRAEKFKLPEKDYHFLNTREHDVSFTFGLVKSKAYYTQLNDETYAVYFPVNPILPAVHHGYLFVSDDNPEWVNIRHANGTLEKIAENWYTVETSY